MDEQKEIKIKTELLNFIKSNFVFEGDEVLVKEKLFDTVELLYQLHIKLSTV